MSAPQSEINICSVQGLDSRYEHTIYFADRTAQRNFFSGKVVHTFSDYTFLRPTWNIKVAATLAQSLQWNYLYFLNRQEGFYYYYFINRINYINDATVELELEMDVMQTFLFEFTPGQSFVERMHTSSDAIGEHTVEEGLEFGDHETYFEWTPLLTDSTRMCVMIMATINPDECTETYRAPAWGNIYNGVLSGLKFYAVESGKWPDLLQLLDNLDRWGYTDGIINMWMYPKQFIQLAGEGEWGTDDLCIEVSGVQPYSAELGTDPFEFVYDETYGYTPKNNKLYGYPYHILYFTNHSGDSAVYHLERFDNAHHINLIFYGALDPGGAVKGAPRYYDGVNNDGYEQGITCSSFPTCAWDSDIYKLWLAQNQHTLQHQNLSANLTIGAGAVASLGSLAMGNVLGAVGGVGGVVSGVMQAEALMAQKKDKSVQPPEARGSYSTNINMASGHIFTACFKRPRAEYLIKLDDFFTKYGYKVNEMITPHFNKRKSHTYIKTVGFNLRGYLKNEIKLKICGIFDNGITFWMDGNRIGYYEDDNVPVN